MKLKINIVFHEVFTDEIADERVADGMREWRRSVAELDDKNKE